MKSEKLIPLQEWLHELHLKIMEECARDMCRIKKGLQAYTQIFDEEDVVFESDEARQAWDQVMGKIREIGSYDTVVFGNPIIHAVIRDMGGWVYLCGLNKRALFFRAYEFGKRYVEYQRQPAVCYPSVLKGRF